MQGIHLGSVPWRNTLATVLIAAAGLITLVGSGGGGSDSCGLLIASPCLYGPPDPLPPLPSAYVDPPRVTVQVGGTAVFTAGYDNIATPSFQWCRKPADSTSCIEIAGATGASYTVAAASLADDGAEYRVAVRGGNLIPRPSGILAVSSLPGVTLEDGEFMPADWAVTASVDPPQNTSTHSEARLATGGHPGAFRQVTHDMAPGVGTLRLLHTWLAASYDPAQRGAVHVIDFRHDCVALSAPNGNVYSAPLVEQGGRRFVANSGWPCVSSAWTALPTIASLGPQDFRQVDGPACGPAESCPDFSASAAPLRFGFAGEIEQPALAGAVSAVRGIDNWQVTVWRP
jgi:hypothetical protein